MNPVFKSKELCRGVFLSEIEELPATDQKLLYEETVEAIRGIDLSVKEISDLEKRSGVSSDSDWLHRAKKKRRICLEFAAKLNTVMSSNAPEEREPSKVSYEEAYKKHFRQILIEELGPDLERIEAEAAELARTDVGRH
jgi:hypothetical protein